MIDPQQFIRNKLTISQIKELAEYIGFRIVSRKKDDVVDEFLHKSKRLYLDEEDNDETFTDFLLHQLLDVFPEETEYDLFKEPEFEEDLKYVVAEYLHRKGYQVFEEVEIPTAQTRADLIGLKRGFFSNELVAVECKTADGNFDAGIRQLIDCSRVADKVFLATTELAYYLRRLDLEDYCETAKAGLLIFNSESFVKEVLKPQKTRTYWDDRESLIKELEE